MTSEAHIPGPAQVHGNPQDGYVIHGADGTRIEVNEHGFVAELPIIRSVGLFNLCEVSSHHVNRAVGSTSHVVRFVNGGHVHFAYTDQGELLELEGRAFRVSDAGDGQLLVGAWNSATGTGTVP